MSNSPVTAANSVFRHLVAILILPFTVTILIPTLVIKLTRTFNPGWALAFPVNLLPIAAGIGLIGGGLTLIVVTVALFKTIGRGTLAPWDPTQRLVITGIYRYVRNPMISGVIGILFGEAALFGSVPLTIWALAAAGVNLVYIPLVEEPGLHQRFGADYQDYTRHVPRWLPRRTPWFPPDPHD